MNRLEETLKRERISISWLAERLGLSRPTLRKYLQKPDEFKIKHVRRVCEYLKITERDGVINLFNSDNYEQEEDLRWQRDGEV